jgi:RNA polymerase sigma-70 factor (ECF subfamily)
VAPEASDAQLVLEVLRKDRKATAEFVNRLADHVYSYIRRRLIPHTEFADDLVQEVFLAAWENLEKFRGESSLRTWLLGIARHKVEDHYRKRLREGPVPGEEENSTPEPVDPHSVEEAIEQQQAAKKTQEILASLPEAHSIVLLWRYWEKRSLSEIAVATGKTEKAVERLLARAREQFKRKWNEQ